MPTATTRSKILKIFGRVQRLAKMSGALLAVDWSVVSSNDLDLVLFFTSTILVFPCAGTSVDI
ncbi:MAG: hypothetical protein PHF57_11390, partial [Methanoregula sp.]|nr:hypothetical protein [Methanoregula sp.]